MDLPLAQIQAAAAAAQDDLIDFTRQIVRIPSLPGEENEVAVVISRKMQQLGYDEVWTDAAGNVIGKIKGGAGPTVMLNGHMDHVDPGPVEGWPQPPFSGNTVDGELWGRAAVDMKGPVACMMVAASLLKRLDLTPPGDVLMTVPVMEEIGGVGTQFLTTQLKADVAICGEPSHNTLRRGHRGRVELVVTFKGRSAHASIPHRGINPHYSAAALLTYLSGVDMVQDEALGQATVAPTLYTIDQRSPNVIPGEVRLLLDWRSVPAESPAGIIARAQGWLEASLAGFEAGQVSQTTVELTTRELTTYTGMVNEFPSIFPSFLLPEDNVFIQTAQETLIEVLKRDEGVDIWRFATDGGHLMAAGIPTIGFGPGDEQLAHTNQERISLAQMNEAVVAYTALVLALAEAAERNT